MELAVFLFLRDGSLAHARASLESLDRTLPPRWPGPVNIVDHTAAGFGGTLPRPGWRTVRSDRNAAVAAATAPILCFLEAGTILLPGWLPPLLRVLRRATRAGIVGGIHREPHSGLIDHAGIGFDAQGLPVAVGRNLALLPRDRCDRRAAVSMACCVLRGETFARLGGFDARFRNRRLDEVDFCLRAAEAGYRHYVANRSVVYRYDDAPLADAPDLPVYRERWGERAQKCLVRRDGLRRAPSDAPFSAERWEMARETRRLHRLEVSETRAVGRRYLAKHWHRPWRYNAARVVRALGQALTPLPGPLHLPPGFPDDAARPDDGWLFDPPPQP